MPCHSEEAQMKILYTGSYSTQDYNSVLFLSPKLQRSEVELKFNLDSFFGGVDFSHNNDLK